jgi:hypothetical protein
MKIKPEHIDHMRNAITPLDTVKRRTTYAGVSNDRYQWDLSYSAGLTRFFCDVLYKYCDDTHIRTALRHIVKPLKVINE